MLEAIPHITQVTQPWVALVDFSWGSAELVDVMPVPSEGSPFHSSASPQMSNDPTPPVQSVMKTVDVQAKFRPSFPRLNSAWGPGKKM